MIAKLNLRFTTKNLPNGVRFQKPYKTLNIVHYPYT